MNRRAFLSVIPAAALSATAVKSASPSFVLKNEHTIHPITGDLYPTGQTSFWIGDRRVLKSEWLRDLPAEWRQGWDLSDVTEDGWPNERNPAHRAMVIDAFDARMVRGWQ